LRWCSPRAAARLRARRRRLESAYERFPILRERRALLAESLSGGEQQMLAIARALPARPRLLLLDEPSLGLAPLIVKRVFETLADLKRQGVTMLLVEQDALRALRLADRAFVMELGRIVMRGAERSCSATRMWRAPTWADEWGRPADSRRWWLPALSGG
jgi:ABC-type branched-subunit amino acid transport system ATPase component